MALGHHQVKQGFHARKHCDAAAVDLKVRGRLSDHRASSMHSVATPAKETARVLGRMDRDGARFHRATQTGAQFKLMNYLFLEFSL